jgi:hypothetical protein
MTRSTGLGVRTVNGDWGNHSLIPGSMEQCLLECARPSHNEPALGYGLFSVVAEFSSSTASARGASVLVPRLLRGASPGSCLLRGASPGLG